MKPVIIRVEAGLKELIEEMADERDRTRSEIIRDLIRVGIGVQKGGGLGIEGPFGGRRPLARLVFEGGKEKLAVRMPEDLIKRMKEQFSGSTREAARKAMRLGSFLVGREKMRITGFFDLPRPFAGAKASPIDDDDAREALKRLQE